MIVGGLTILLTACNPKDEAYYFKNLDVSVDKATSCDQALIKAAIVNDEKTMKKLEMDGECHAAFNALQKKSQLDRDSERAEMERQRTAEQVAREEAISDHKKNIMQSLPDNNWSAVITEYFKQDECQYRFLEQDNYHCAAWKSLYEGALIEGKEQLLQESFASLNQQEHFYCDLDKRRGSACDVWIQAIEERTYQDLSGLNIIELDALKERYCSFKVDPRICDVWKKRWSEQESIVID